MYVSVRVVAAAKHEKIEELKAGRLRIWVQEPARQNLANKRVRALVAGHFGVALHNVRLISGHTSPAKIFSIDPIDSTDLAEHA